MLSSATHKPVYLFIVCLLQNFLDANIMTAYLGHNGTLDAWQADVCHAYQILRKGGIKEENIVVFIGMKTDRIRTDITHIIFVFIFLFGFGFGHG